MRKHLRASDLRSVARLATEATEGITRIVEGVHHAAWNPLGLPPGRIPGRTRGLTGWIYRRIYRFTRRLGRGTDAVLARMEQLLDTDAETRPGTRQREAVLAALNGVMGDRLLASGNALATPMTLRHRGEPLAPDGPLSISEATGKIVVLIHGLCMNDRQWEAQHEGQPVDHGAVLREALGATPVYLRYNSGRHVSENGRDLAAVLERLVARWPVPVEDLTVVAHSMGGLLTRSAFHVARQDGLCWPDRLRAVVFLGTPHHGAPLERGGNGIDMLLGTTRFSAPFAALGQLRSAGVTDLRYGNLLDADWQGRPRFRRSPDGRQVLPLPDGVACYAMAATTAASRTVLADRLVGDGLVPLRSALGQHDDPQRALAFTDSQIAYETHHFALLSRPEVSDQLVRWLA